MAIVPLSGTNIRLMSGIPFSSDYKHTRWFDTITEQTNYFLAKPIVHQMTEANFQRIEGKSYVAVNASIDELHSAKYIMFQNAQYNNKWFYAFVEKLEYKNKGLTHVHMRLDVLQTWRFEMVFRPSYVVREHRPLWNADGSPVINTVDEGLNYGTEYDVVSIEQYKPTFGYKWLVIATKTPMHYEGSVAVTPNVVGTPQPLTYYIVPFKDDDTVPNVYISDISQGILLSKPTEVLKGLYTDEQAVNNVVSIYVSDYVGISCSEDENGTLTFSGGTVRGVQIADGASYFNCLRVNKVNNFSILSENIGNKYSGYKSVTESKLLMHPYTELVFMDFKGNIANFKNEYISSQNIVVRTKGSLGTSNKTSYGISDYNTDTNSSLVFETSDENALINNEPNDIPIITDLLSAYLQGNKNAIQVSKDSAVFNGVVGGINSAITGVGSAMMRNPIGVASATTEVVQGAGNTVLQLQAINAKQKDIANVPPQLSKQGSNSSYTVGNRFNGLFIIKKQIKPEYRKKLSDFFKMFGYKTNEVKVPNFHTRQNWNYVQTESCHIKGDFNNEDLNELQSIFDSGITLWHYDDVGNYALENEVI